MLAAIRVVRVRAPFADAGRDAVTVTGRSVEVGVEPGMQGVAGGRVRPRWRIAKAPRGARPRLADADSATPRLTA